MGSSIRDVIQPRFFPDDFASMSQSSSDVQENTIMSEQSALPNNNSIRGLDVASGPTWEVPLGRRDSLTANQTLLGENLPGANFTLDQLKSKFITNQNLNITDLVALSGTLKKKKLCTKKTSASSYKTKNGSFSQVPTTPNNCSSHPSSSQATHHSLMHPPLYIPTHQRTLKLRLFSTKTNSTPQLNIPPPVESQFNFQSTHSPQSHSQPSHAFQSDSLPSFASQFGSQLIPATEPGSDVEIQQSQPVTRKRPWVVDVIKKLFELECGHKVSRGEIWIVTHKHSNGEFVNEEAK
ncbi:hypothetical protein Fmac_015093 [Flemingia macrophylla]|uniref:Peroxidase n=1 Tax=Flemingia macrophylla TaxID=520843 RepID=A0ABD1MDK7_9FABA